jgi:hypothetical protein
MIGRSFADLTDAFIWVGRFNEATETARCGLVHLENEISANRVRLVPELGQASAASVGREPASAALREALDLASQVSDPKLEARLLGARSIANFHYFRFV